MNDAERKGLLVDIVLKAVEAKELIDEDDTDLAKEMLDEIIEKAQRGAEITGS